MIQIAVLGYGTIGSGVAEAIKSKNKESITKTRRETKYLSSISWICVNFREIRWKIRSYMIMRLSKNDPKIAIVVEAMGGVEPAYTFAKQALRVVNIFATSNKALIAEKGAELIRHCKGKKCELHV